MKAAEQLEVALRSESDPSVLDEIKTALQFIGNGLSE
jgi:hypothetical protein